MKLAISGKGGVGKTTIAAGLARRYVANGFDVLAVDADPDANLAEALGYAGEITPISGMKDLIAERTGGQPGTYGVFVKLNPEVSDLPDRLTVDVGGVKVLTLGAVRRGGGGCACPENVLLRNLLSHVILRRGECIIVDMEAGIEHLGRSTVEAVDALAVVVEPSQRSLGTAFRIRDLAEEVGLKSIVAIGSKVRGQKDRDFVKDRLEGFPILGWVSYNEEIQRADQTGEAKALDAPLFTQEIDDIMSQLVRYQSNS